MKISSEIQKFKLRSVDETLFKIVKRDFNMDKITDDIFDLAKVRYDKLKRRIYDIEKNMNN